MGECSTCARSKPAAFVWGRYACTCGRDFCSIHATEHDQDTVNGPVKHNLLDKSKLLRGVLTVLDSGAFP